MGVHASDVAIKRQLERVGCRVGHSQRYAQDSVGPQFPLVGRAIQFQQERVNPGLVGTVPAEQFVGDDIVDIGNGLQHTLTAVTSLIAVAQFQRLVDAGGGPGGDSGPPPGSSHQHHLHFNSGVPPRIQNLAGDNGINLSLDHYSSISCIYHLIRPFLSRSIRPAGPRTAPVWPAAPTVSCQKPVRSLTCFPGPTRRSAPPRTAPHPLSRFHRTVPDQGAVLPPPTEVSLRRTYSPFVLGPSLSIQPHPLIQPLEVEVISQQGLELLQFSRLA